MNDVDKHYGCPFYKDKSVMEMSEIELKGLLIILINDYSKERLKNLVVKLSNTHYHSDFVVKETEDARPK